MRGFRGGVVALTAAAALLVAASFNVAQSWTWKERGLLDAAMMGDLKGVKDLLGKGADTNTADSEGDSPLIRAAAMGHAELVKLLVARGADIHARDSQGKTALDMAKERHYSAVAKIPLERGRRNR